MSAANMVQRLYPALGFRPICITRQYVKERPADD